MSTIEIYQNLLTQLDKLFRHSRQCSHKTRTRYREAMKRFCRFLAEEYRLEKLANISDKHLKAYVAHMKAKGLSASTTKTDLAGIRYFCDQMPKTRHQLPSNDTLDLQRRSFGKVDRTWSWAEFNRMLAHMKLEGREDYVAILCLARYASLRIHECFRIDTAIAHDAIKNMAITITGKGGKVRTTPINESVRIELEKMLKVTPRGHKLFVPEGMKTHIAISRLQAYIANKREAVQDEGSTKPMTMHGLRHSCAAEWYKNLLAQGWSEQDACSQVSRWLGHERPEITHIYLASLREDGGTDV